MTTYLLNTVEFNVYDYFTGKSQPQSPNEPTDEEWNEYVKLMWSLTEISHLPMIDYSYYLVDMNDIDDKAIESFINKTFSNLELDEDDYLDCISCFMGGIVVMQDGKPAITPHCCGDVFDISNWEDMLKHPSREWCGIWNGHPGISYRTIGGNIEFANHTKENQPVNELKIAASMPIAEFKIQIERMKQTQRNLHTRLSNKVEQMEYVDYEEIAKRICFVY